MKVLIILSMFFSLGIYAACGLGDGEKCDSKKECDELSSKNAEFDLMFNESNKTCYRHQCKDTKMQLKNGKCEPLDCKSIVDSAQREAKPLSGDTGSSSGVKAKDQ